MIEEIKGNILNTNCKVIAHGVNCQNVMGSGVAKVLFTKWPRVKGFYHDYFDEFDSGIDGENFLGKVDDIAITRNGPIIVNCFTQQYYGYNKKLYLSYEAVSSCMKKLLKVCEYNQVKEVAMPKIGCGLAGGDWSRVKEIIEDTFPDDFTVKVYYL